MRALVFIFSLVCAGTLFAQPNWEFDVTDKSHTILIPSAIVNSSFESGDFIGVFYEMNGALLCAGYSEYSNENFVVTAFGSSFSFSGFESGQVFHFKHWSMAANTEQELFVEYNNQDFPNSSQFVIDGMSGISAIVENAILGCTDPEAVNFDELSSYDNGSCISVFQNLYASSLDSITGLHAAYNSEYEYLHDSMNLVISLLQSSLVLTEDTLAVQTEIIIELATEIDLNIDSLNVLNQIIGSLNAELILKTDTIDFLNQPILIDLVSGWNMIGYSGVQEMNLEDGFLLIEDEVSIVKDNNGNVYWPNYNFNGIGNLIPGQGYQINMINATVFSFPNP